VFFDAINIEVFVYFILFHIFLHGSFINNVLFIAWEQNLRFLMLFSKVDKGFKNFMFCFKQSNSRLLAIIRPNG